MATSQNGGLVVQYGDPRLIATTIPGTNGAKFIGGIVGADLNLVFMYMAARWNREVEPIIGPGNITGLWGHNVRSIRGQESGYSNHSSGEAVDIMAVRHPLGTRTLTPKQRVAINRISNDLDGVLRFGANYSGRPDEMHVERDGPYWQVRAIADRIRSGRMPNTPPELLVDYGIPSRPAPIPDPQVPKPAPIVKPIQEEDEMFFMYAPNRPVVIVVDGRAGDLTGLNYDATVKGFRDAGVKEVNFPTDAAFDAVLRVVSSK